MHACVIPIASCSSSSHVAVGTAAVARIYELVRPACMHCACTPAIYYIYIYIYYVFQNCMCVSNHNSMHGSLGQPEIGFQHAPP